MSTRLTQAATSTKQLAVVFGVLIIVFIIGKYSYDAVIIWREGSKPTPSPFINTKYGVLPRLPVNQATPTSKGLRIELNTSDLQVPKVTYTKPTVPVYEFKKRNTTFNFITNLQKIGEFFGINNVSPQQLGDTLTYRLSNETGSVLDVDVKYYKITYEQQNRIAYVPIQLGATIDQRTAQGEAVAIFNKISPYIEADTNKSKLKQEVKFAFLDLNNQTKEVNSQAQANLTYVYLYRNDINNIPFIGTDLSNPNIKFTYTTENSSTTGRGSGRPKLLSASITYFPIAENSTTAQIAYPIKTITDAYQDVVNGKAFVLSPINTQLQYQISRAYLAYLEPKEFAPYAIPVWVFEGDSLENTKLVFRAITPAVARGYIEE